VRALARASVLCPYFVPTGISQSHRNRPLKTPGISMSTRPMPSQLISQAMSDKAVASGKLSAAEVAQAVGLPPRLARGAGDLGAVNGFVDGLVWR